MSTRSYAYLFIIAVLSLALVSLKRYQPLPAEIDAQAFLHQSLQEANTLRTQIGLPPLASDPHLQNLLQTYAGDGRVRSGLERGSAADGRPPRQTRQGRSQHEGETVGKDEG